MSTSNTATSTRWAVATVAVVVLAIAATVATAAQRVENTGKQTHVAVVLKRPGAEGHLVPGMAA